MCDEKITQPLADYTLMLRSVAEKAKNAGDLRLAFAALVLADHMEVYLDAVRNHLLKKRSSET